MSNADVYAAIARNLTDFGYQGITSDMIREIHQAKLAGEELPHGIIGMFAKDQLQQAEDSGLLAR